jgi:hypothetical protein
MSCQKTVQGCTKCVQNWNVQFKFVPPYTHMTAALWHFLLDSNEVCGPEAGKTVNDFRSVCAQANIYQKSNRAHKMHFIKLSTNLCTINMCDLSSLSQSYKCLLTWPPGPFPCTFRITALTTCFGLWSISMHILSLNIVSRLNYLILGITALIIRPKEYGSLKCQISETGSKVGHNASSLYW